MMKHFVHIDDLQRSGQPEPDAAPLVWVPGEAFSCHRVTVPPVARKKWQAMIPWLLEEHLLEPPEALVFASGDKAGDNSVPVIAASRQRLAEWRQRLTAAGRDYSALAPDFFALPWREGQVSVGAIGDRLLVRSDRWQGAAGEADFILPLLLQRSVDADVVVFHQGPVPAWRDRVDDRWQFRQVIDLFTPVDLTSGDWLAIADSDRGGKSRRLLRGGLSGWSLPARVAAALVVAFIGLTAASSMMEGRQLAQEVEHLQGELRRGYRQYFGETYDFAMADFQRVVSARLAGEGRGESAAMAVARRLSGWLADCSDCVLQSLRIESGDLNAVVSGEGAEAHLTSLAAQMQGLSLVPDNGQWQLSYGSEAGRGE